MVKLTPTVSDGLWSGDTGTFADLSHELLSLVLSHLGFAEKLLFATSVCKSFRSLLKWKHLWTRIGLQVPKGKYIGAGAGAAGFRFSAIRDSDDTLLRIAPSRVMEPFSLLAGAAPLSLALDDMPTPTLFSKVLKLDQMKSLKSLYLSGIKVNQAVANTVVAKQAASLQTLVIKENRIPQAIKIKLLEACPDLRSLNTDGFMNAYLSKSSSGLRTTLTMQQIRLALANGRGGGDAKPVLEVLVCNGNYPSSLQTLGEWFPEVQRFNLASSYLADLVTETPFPQALRLTDLHLTDVKITSKFYPYSKNATSADFQSTIKKVMAGSDDAAFPSLQNLTIAFSSKTSFQLGTALDGGSNPTLMDLTLKYCIAKPSDFANFHAPNLNRIEVTFHTLVEATTTMRFARKARCEGFVNSFFEMHPELLEEDFLAPVDNFRIEAARMTDGKLKGFTMHHIDDA